MSKPLSRRGLFSAFVPLAPKAPVARADVFSLTGFYAARTGAGAPSPFALRTGLPQVPPSAVGSGTTRVVQVNAAHCVGPQSFCTVCVERCPKEGAIQLEGALPRIDPALCDGCGECVSACPAPLGTALEWKEHRHDD